MLQARGDWCTPNSRAVMCVVLVGVVLLCTTTAPQWGCHLLPCTVGVYEFFCCFTVLCVYVYVCVCAGTVCAHAWGDLHVFAQTFIMRRIAKLCRTNSMYMAAVYVCVYVLQTKGFAHLPVGLIGTRTAGRQDVGRWHAALRQAIV